MPESSQDRSHDRLDEALKAWGDAEVASDSASDCPVISVLWLHERQGQPLGEHEEHVQACYRCQRRLELIHAEVRRDKEDTEASQATGLGRRISAAFQTVTTVLERPRIRWLAGGAVAMAACILLAVILFSRSTAYAGDYLTDGLFREAEQRYRESLEDAELAVREDPNLRAAWLLKARVLFLLDRVGEAKAIAERILAEDPEDAVANLQMAAFVRSADPQAAATYERKAKARMPEDAEAWYVWGRLAGRLKKDRRIARQRDCYTRALELDPNHARARLRHAWVSYELGDYAGMLADAKVLVRLRPDWANAWDTLAVARDRSGQYDAAIPAFTRAIELDLTEPLTYCNRGNTFLRLKQFDRALADTDAAKRLEPDEFAPYWIAGRAYRYLGQLDQAIREFQQAYNLCPPTHGHNAYICLHLFIVLKEAGRDGQVERIIKHATCQSADSDQWIAQVVAFYAGGLSLDELLEAAGDDPGKRCEAFYYIGELDYVEGRRNDAPEWFEKCIATGAQRFIEYEYAAWRLHLMKRDGD